MIKESTQVQNVLFDQLLPNLTESELKVLLIVIRQTNGWVDKRTGKRKIRDWISHSQFVKKTGLSRRIISTSVQNLVAKGLITVTDRYGNLITIRQGQPKIFYSPNMCTLGQEPVQFLHNTCAETAHNKTNYTKIRDTKGRGSPFRTNTVMQIGEILKSTRYSSI